MTMNTRKKVYISAPITGYDLHERREFFKRVSKLLVSHGYHPVNPLKNGIPPTADVKKHMKADFSMLLGCDNILLCEGWEQSTGCQREATVALWSGISVFDKTQLEL